jgi:peptide subunit release factor 1 (eRF1)
MLNQAQIESLIGLPDDGHPVVSLFLEVDGATDRDSSYVPRAEELVRAARAGLLGQKTISASQRDDALTDLDRVVHFVREEFVRENHRGLVVFASRARRLWRVFPLFCRVKDRIVVEGHAYVRPLVQLMEDNPRCGVALVGREKGRLFVIEQGEVASQQEIADAVPGRIRPASRYGLADASRLLERHVDEQIHRHLRYMSAVLDTLVREEGLEYVLIGGPPDVLPEFRRTLTRKVRERIVGSIPIPLHLTPEEVLARSIASLQEARRAADETLIRDVLDEAGPNGERFATVGLAPTLDMLYRGAIQILVVGRDRAVSGLLCRRCGRLFAEGSICPVCGDTQPGEIQDLIEEAVDSALRGGAEVVFMEETPDWARRGGIGALLRFLPEPGPSV